jgi:hypothetical protein
MMLPHGLYNKAFFYTRSETMSDESAFLHSDNEPGEEASSIFLVIRDGHEAFLTNKQLQTEEVVDEEEDECEEHVD